MNPQVYNLLSFLPIVVLLIISLWKGVKPGVFIGFLVTVALYFLWGNNALAFGAILFSALVGTVNILMIIFGAVFLYYVMEQKAYIKGIQLSLAEIHPDNGFRFYFLAFFLTAFFESVAGFGTPGAIVPLLLMTMGYDAVLSITVVLLIDGLFALTGAVGTPVTAGLEASLSLGTDMVGKIYLYSAVIMLGGGIVIVYFVRRFTQRSSAVKGYVVWVFFLTIAIPFILLAPFTRELTGLIASVVMALFSYVFLFKSRKLHWQPWTPYFLLILLLLIPKVFPWFAQLLSQRFEFNSIMGTEISASIQPFRSPLIPFLAAALFALYQAKSFTLDLKPVISRTVAVFIILFPSLALTQLMLNSGGEMPSMIEAMSSVFAGTGTLYPLFSPLIGVLGAFISGSTTVSNLIFGSAQYASAQSLMLPPEIVLSLQLVGASLGNAVCLFNIIAAAAVAGVKEYKEILNMNLWPVILACVMSSLVAYVAIWLL